VSGTAVSLRLALGPENVYSGGRGAKVEQAERKQRKRSAALPTDAVLRARIASPDPAGAGLRRKKEFFSRAPIRVQALQSVIQPAP
jgi:hypothetical protein